MAVTLRPKLFMSVPVLEAMTPLPIPEITPPETTIYLVIKISLFYIKKEKGKTKLNDKQEDLKCMPNSINIERGRTTAVQRKPKFLYFSFKTEYKL